MPTTLVVGATGYLGRHLVAELAQQDHQVRALVRDRSRAERPGKLDSPSLTGLVSDWVVGDVTDDALVADLAAGADHVVSALGVTSQGSDPWLIDYAANLAVLRSALAHGVRSFTYVNALGADRCPAQLTRAKTAFANALELADIDGLIVNPSGYFSDLAMLLPMARRGFVPMMKRNVRLNPIHGEDLAAAIVARMAVGQTGSWDVGGPDVYTWQQLADEAFAALNRQGRTVIIPRFVAPVLLRLLTLVSPRKADSAQFGVWAMTNDCVGEAVGEHTVAAFFAEQAAAS